MLSRYAAIPASERNALSDRIKRYSAESAALDIEFDARRRALSDILTVDIGRMLVKVFGRPDECGTEQQDSETIG